MAAVATNTFTLNERGLKFYAKRIKAAETVPDSAMKEYVNAKLPAYKAAFDGNIEALEGVMINAVHKGGIQPADKGITPVHMAIKGNKMDSVKWLLKYTTISVQKRTSDGKTPLHIAVEQGNMDCIKVLLTSDEKGLKQNVLYIEDKAGLTCLMLAVQKHQNAMFKFLLAELGGPKALPITNSQGLTVAHVAASTGNFEILKMIHSKQRKLLLQKTKDGCTPVYYAAQENQPETLAYLHETANCPLDDATVTEGLKLIHVAAKNNHLPIIEYLMTKLGTKMFMFKTLDGSNSLHVAATAGSLDAVRWIMCFDSNKEIINDVDNIGNTPVHNAADAGRVSILRIFIEDGANIYLANKKGSTPRSLAIATGNQEMIKLVTKNDDSMIDSAIDPTYSTVDEVTNTSSHPPPEEVMIEKDEMPEQEMTNEVDIDLEKTDEAAGDEEEMQEETQALEDGDEGEIQETQALEDGDEGEMNEEESETVIKLEDEEGKDKEDTMEKEELEAPGEEKEEIAIADDETEKQEDEKAMEEIEGQTEEKGEEEDEEVTEAADEKVLQEPIYSVPDPEVVAQKRLPPPIPPQDFAISKELGPKKALSTTALGRWPHASQEDTGETKRHLPPKRSTSTKSVTSLWPPRQQDNVKTTAEVVPVKNVKKRWPPVKEDEEEEEKPQEIKEEVKEVPEEIEEEKQEEKEEEEEPPKMFVQLRKTVKSEPKKRETLEGAGSELKELLMKRKIVD